MNLIDLGPEYGTFSDGSEYVSYPCTCCVETKGNGCTDGPFGWCCPCCNGTGREFYPREMEAKTP